MREHSFSINIVIIAVAAATIIVIIVIYSFASDFYRNVNVDWEHVYQKGSNLALSQQIFLRRTLYICV